MEMVLIETYAQRDTAVGTLAASGRRAAQEMTRGGHDVRYIQTVFVAIDETCFHLFEADSTDAVVAGTRDTSLGSARVVSVAASLAVDEQQKPRKEERCAD
jgi:hypothetical protein